MINRLTNHPRLLAAIALTVALSLGACGDEDEGGPSNDMSELASTVSLGLPAAKGTFEIVYTPESRGMLPGPTDYVSLVAELEIPGGSPPPRADSHALADTYALSGMTRPWLSQPFRALLKAASSDRMALGRAGCEPFAAKITKSGRDVSGFSCRRGARMLIYLLLSDLNDPDRNN